MTCGPRAGDGGRRTSAHAATAGRFRQASPGWLAGVGAVMDEAELGVMPDGRANKRLVSGKLRLGDILGSSPELAGVKFPWSTVAEDRRFELLRGCPQHAFQVCGCASTPTCTPATDFLAPGSAHENQPDGFAPGRYLVPLPAWCCLRAPKCRLSYAPPGGRLGSGLTASAGRGSR